MPSIRISGIVTALVFVFFLLCPVFSAGQDVSAADETRMAGNTSDHETVEPLQIRLSVNEVRLDVVVLDKKGNPITDLTADDFEVSQDKKRQEILSSVYIDSQSNTVPQTSASRKNTRNLPPLPAVAMKREDTLRTIIFIVDDISMNFAEGYYAKMALRNFVEKQMRIGDMVAILKTSYGNSALQLFLSDKSQMLARIDAIRLERTLGPNPNDVEESHLFRIYDNQVSAISYSLRALRDMPGRKILIMMTAVPKLRKVKEVTIFEAFILGNHSMGGVDFDSTYNGRFTSLADDALRAGVVVNFLDIKGLQNHAEQEFSIYGKLEGIDPYLLEMYERMRNEPPGAALNPLPLKTGGVTIENSNFFLGGIGSETEGLIRGYYLVSYTPPPDTFNSDGKAIYHNIKINVKRKNVQIYTRDGFYNRLEGKTYDDTTQNPLAEAIFSPFLYADLNVNMFAGYVKDAKARYLVRSWIHLDPKDVKIVETEDGGARIDLEMACLTSDINGFVQDFKHVKHALKIEPENKSDNIAWIQEHGIRFTMLLPVKKPGSYYVRTAVEDKESGKIGSAYQYVEIPDLGKKGLALSNIFIVTSAEDLKWMLSDAEEWNDKGLFFPEVLSEEVRSPALRTYAPGDVLNTLVALYNADDKAIRRSEVEIQTIVYKDGMELRRSEPMPITARGADSSGGFWIIQRFTVGSDMPPGEYVRRIVITDKKNGKKTQGVASQTMSFTVKEK